MSDRSTVRTAVSWAPGVIAACLGTLLVLAGILGDTYACHAQGRTRTYRSAHILLTAPAAVDASRVVDELERAYRDVVRFGLRLPPTIDVRSYSTTSEFTRMSGGERYHLAISRGGVVRLQPVSLLLRRGDLARALRHELVHVAVQGMQAAGLPRWLNEGLALTVAGERPTGTLMFEGLAALEDTLRQSRSYRSVRAAYGTAGRLVATLVAGYGKARVVRLVGSSTDSNAFERAFAELSGTTLQRWGQEQLRPSKR